MHPFLRQRSDVSCRTMPSSFYIRISSFATPSSTSASSVPNAAWRGTPHITEQNEAEYCRLAHAVGPRCPGVSPDAGRQIARVMSPKTGTPRQRQIANDEPTTTCDSASRCTPNKTQKTPSADPYGSHWSAMPTTLLTGDRPADPIGQVREIARGVRLEFERVGRVGV